MYAARRQVWQWVRASSDEAEGCLDGCNKVMAEGLKFGALRAEAVGKIRLGEASKIDIQ